MSKCDASAESIQGVASLRRNSRGPTARPIHSVKITVHRLWALLARSEKYSWSRKMLCQLKSWSNKAFWNISLILLICRAYFSLQLRDRAHSIHSGSACPAVGRQWTGSLSRLDKPYYPPTHHHHPRISSRRSYSTQSLAYSSTTDY